MRKFIAKSFGYPFQDYIKSTNIINTLKFLRESQFWDEARIRDYQTIKLKTIVEHAYKNVPYYEDLFKKINLKPGDIKSLDDINKIPILTKEIARKENLRLIARGFQMKNVKKGKTGGTTGVPIIVYKDTTNRSITWGSYYRWYEWMGINYYDKSATFWGSKTVLNKSLKTMIFDGASRYLQNSVSFNSFELTENRNWDIYKKLKVFKPDILKGYVSALLDFGSFLDRNNLKDIKPKAMSSTSETLLPHQRKYMERIFKAPVFDQYGCGELSAISYECAAHNGLHINLEHMMCEILDENNQQILDAKGRLIGTDLDNYVMPFIRYENGDLSSISSKKCTCGVNQPLMNSIDGRTTDTLVLSSGSKVHGVFITDILYELDIFTDKIQRFQAYQGKPGSLDIKIECESALDYELRTKLITTLYRFFNEVHYSEHKKLQTEPNGKFKYVISNLI